MEEMGCQLKIEGNGLKWKNVGYSDTGNGIFCTGDYCRILCTDGNSLERESEFETCCVQIIPWHTVNQVCANCTSSE